MDAKAYNMRNPAVKRILQGDIFEWHFVIRGPPDTEFEGGIYHGRILLPPEYPFKPPAFMMLTPSGRFETNVKICLSMSSHHPEHWQPSWSVRTALTALIAFLPSPGQGALGSLDFSKEERRVLAARAHKEPPTFGSAERQRIIDEMHQRMLLRLESLGGAKSKDCGEATQASPQQGEAGDAPATPGTPSATPASSSPLAPAAQQAETPASAVGAAVSVARPPTPLVSAAAQPGSPPAVPQQQPAAAAAPFAPGPAGVAQQQQQPQQLQQAQSADHGLTLLAIALSIGIAAILLRKVLAAFSAAGYEF